MSLLNKMLGGMIAAALAAVMGMWIMNMHLRAELAEARLQTGALIAANDEFKARVDAQNRAVAKLQAEAEARALAAQKALRAADKAARGHLANAEALRREAAKGDACAAADRLLTDYIGRLK